MSQLDAFDCYRLNADFCPIVEHDVLPVVNFVRRGGSARRPAPSNSVPSDEGLLNPRGSPTVRVVSLGHAGLCAYWLRAPTRVVERFELLTKHGSDEVLQNSGSIEISPMRDDPRFPERHHAVPEIVDHLAWEQEQTTSQDGSRSSPCVCFLLRLRDEGCTNVSAEASAVVSSSTSADHKSSGANASFSVVLPCPFDGRVTRRVVSLSPISVGGFEPVRILCAWKGPEDETSLVSGLSTAMVLSDATGTKLMSVCAADHTSTVDPLSTQTAAPIVRTGGLVDVGAHCSSIKDARLLRGRHLFFVTDTEELMHLDLSVSKNEQSSGQHPETTSSAQGKERTLSAGTSSEPQSSRDPRCLLSNVLGTSSSSSGGPGGDASWSVLTRYQKRHAVEVRIRVSEGGEVQLEKLEDEALPGLAYIVESRGARFRGVRFSADSVVVEDDGGFDVFPRFVGLGEMVAVGSTAQFRPLPRGVSETSLASSPITALQRWGPSWFATVDDGERRWLAELRPDAEKAVISRAVGGNKRGRDEDERDQGDEARLPNGMDREALMRFLDRMEE